MINKYFHCKICLNWSQNVPTDKIWGKWDHWVEFYGIPKKPCLRHFRYFLTPLNTATQYTMTTILALWGYFALDMFFLCFKHPANLNGLPCIHPAQCPLCWSKLMNYNSSYTLFSFTVAVVWIKCTSFNHFRCISLIENETYRILFVEKDYVNWKNKHI